MDANLNLSAIKTISDPQASEKQRIAEQKLEK